MKAYELLTRAAKQKACEARFVAEDCPVVTLPSLLLLLHDWQHLRKLGWPYVC